MKPNYKTVEINIATSISKLKGEKLPNNLPEWMIKEGIKPAAKILSATDIGDANHNNKTDVLVELENSNPLKLSVKKENADYYGNWYSHQRIIDDFGTTIFNKLTTVTTEWANKYKNDPAWENKLFVGVSINFGKRSGKTFINFEDVFNNEDILTIVKGEGNGSNAANALIISNTGIISSPQDLIANLEEITTKNILGHINAFNIIFRPINPKTEKSNRGKNTFTRFIPYKKLETPTLISTMSELNKLGTFHTVTPKLDKPKLTHNYILKDLKENYNIIIEKKEK